MVGHTGDLAAAVKAVETVDACLGRARSRRSSRRGGVMLITADHGNAEQMYDDATDQPHTAHTLNRVPFAAVQRAGRRPLAAATASWQDIAPTLLALMRSAAAAGNDRPFAAFRGRPAGRSAVPRQLPAASA